MKCYCGLEEYCKIFNVTVIRGKISDVAERVLLRMRISMHHFIQQGCKMIFMRAQISIETETIVKFESLQTLLVSAGGVTTPKTFTATTTSRGNGLMYISQMELYRTNQNKNKTASLSLGPP